jgi:hypothetical protein
MVRLCVWMCAFGCAAGESLQSADGTAAPAPIDANSHIVVDGPPPVDAQPIDAQPIDAQPIDAQPIDAQPIVCVGGDLQTVDPTSGHCYLLFLTPFDWPSARLSCLGRSANSHLSVHETAAENAFVSAFTLGRDVWIGANDMVSEGSWVWETGQDFSQTFVNWAPGEPNSDGNEDCCLLYGDSRSGWWNDEQCSTRRAYVCELE